jgi:hypothetical protein
MFGVLIARYTMISSQSSAEDYLWAQALYSADSAAQLRMLTHDVVGDTSGWTDRTINTFTSTITSGPTQFGTSGIWVIRSEATRPINSGPITRTIEVRYSLE